MAEPHKIRDIAEEKRFEKQLADLGVSQRKLDDLLEGFGVTIAKRPERFARDDESGWSRIIVKAFPPDIPALRIWFTFDNEKVYLEGVELIEEF